MKIRSVGFAAVLAATSFLSACAPTVVTKFDARSVRTEAITAARESDAPDSDIAAARQELRAAIDARSPEDATAAYLRAARNSWTHLRGKGVEPTKWLVTPATRDAAIIYNAACLGFFSQHGKELAAGRSIQTTSGTVPVEFDAPEGHGAGFYDDLIAARTVKVRGFAERATIPGLGVALVGARYQTPERSAELQHFPPDSGIMQPLNGMLVFDKNGKPGARVLNLARRNSLTVKGLKVPLAGDFTATSALSLNGTNDMLMGIRGLLNPGRQLKYAKVYLLEPFDPERIPVVMVHGLGSSPLIWRQMVADLSRHEKIRENYQFWMAYYPSGLSLPNSMAFLRERLAGLRKLNDPQGKSRASKRMVLIGHSMGAVINRANTMEIEDNLWDRITDRPFSDLPVDAKAKDQLRRLIFWEPIAGVDRGIYIAGPHRGATMADSSLGHLGIRLIKLPVNLLRTQANLIGQLAGYLTGTEDLRRYTNSISSLSPSFPLYPALEKSLPAPGYKYHSIIGDRGRGDTPDSSDGVVGYWSSHLSEAQSELIVPASHQDAFEILPAREEVRRILIENLQASK